MSSSDAAPGSALNTVYLIIIQVVSRGLTFVGNQTLLRFVQPRHLGLAVQLEALSISVLYTSRESLRVALQRSPTRQGFGTKSRIATITSQAVINIAWLAVGLGLTLDSVFTTFYRLTLNQELKEAKDFEIAFWLYNTATILELLSEPCFVVIQQHSLYNVRARAETLAAIVKCLSSCTSATVMSRRAMPQSVLPFAVGQFLYGLTLLLVYVWSVHKVKIPPSFSLLPKSVEKSSDVIMGYIPKPLLALAGAFYGQSVFKWLLTQGDTLVLSAFASLDAQGVFALASNYGGLASRLLFQPVEESSRNYFGNLLAPATKKPFDTPKNPRVLPETARKRTEALEYLSRTLRAYLSLVAIPCCILLTQIFPLLIQGLLGSNSAWKSMQTADLLSAYSYYIPCLAINGILDAFVTSVATEAELGVQSLMMVGVTMIYLSVAYFSMVVLAYGAVGLVYANILGMLLRIMFSVWFIWVWTGENIPQTKIKGKPPIFLKFVNESLPSRTTTLTAIIAFTTMQVRRYIKASLSHTAIVAGLMGKRLPILNMDLFDVNFLLTLAIQVITSILIGEREFLIDFISPLLPARVKSKLELQTPTTKEKL